MKQQKCFGSLSLLLEITFKYFIEQIPTLVDKPTRLRPKEKRNVVEELGKITTKSWDKIGFSKHMRKLMKARKATVSQKHITLRIDRKMYEV